jgi:preprotein translocase subunit SecG
VNTLAVVVALVLVAVISVTVMMLVVIVVVNCGREDGGGDVFSVYNQRSRHNQYAITEAVTVTQFPAFTLCLFFPLARSPLIFMALPISSCQFLLGHPL